MGTLESFETFEPYSEVDYTDMLTTITDNQEELLEKLGETNSLLTSCNGLLDMIYRILLYILVALLSAFLWRFITRWISSVFEDNTKIM